MAIDPKKQLPKGPQTSNEQFFDALIRHQIFLLRTAGSITKDIIAILNATEKELANRIRNDLAKIGVGLTPRNRQKLRRLIKEIQAIRSPAWDEISDTWFDDFRKIVKEEPLFLSTATKATLPVIISPGLPSVPELTSMVTNNPFEGRTLSQWASKIERDDINRIRNQITIGLVQGETGNQIARRVVGTARLRGTDGVTQITRREASTITRTAVTAYSNMAKREFYLENKDIIKGELYVATLDARTCWSKDTLITMADGSKKRIGEIKKGDFVLGGLSGESCEVLGTEKSLSLSSVATYNKGKYVGDTTDEHKLLTRQGWKEAGDICLHSQVSKQKVLCRDYKGFEEQDQRTQIKIKGEWEFSTIECNQEVWDARDSNIKSCGFLQESFQAGDKIYQEFEDFSPTGLQLDKRRRRSGGSSTRDSEKGSQKIKRGLLEEFNQGTKIQEREGCKIQLDRILYEEYEGEKDRAVLREVACFQPKAKVKINSEENGKIYKGSLERSKAQEESKFRKRKETSRFERQQPRMGEEKERKSFCCNEAKMERSRIHKEERSFIDETSSQKENGRKREEGSSSIDTRRSGEKKNSINKYVDARKKKTTHCNDEEILGRSKEQEKSFDVYEEEIKTEKRKGPIEIFSLTIEGDNSYVAGGIIVHNTAICRSLDGQTFEVGIGPIPPLHFNCRSVRIAFYDGDDLATRPSKPTTERMLVKEFTTTKGLQQVSTRARLPRGFKGQYDSFARNRTRELIGTVPAKVTYNEWLGRQSVSFQNDVLGVTKARLFRKGLTLDKFVNRRGDELTLNQLVIRDRQAFIDAGLDPDNFN